VKTTGLYPALTFDGQGASVVPNAGAVLLLRTAETVGLSSALVEALRPWQRPLARHRPGKVLLDLAVALAVGGRVR
jgi:Transposase DDE domain group 1